MNVAPFETLNYSIQARTFCHFQLNTPCKEIVLNFPQLLTLRNKLNELTTTDSLNRIINNENFVLLFIADYKHVLYLDIANLLAIAKVVNTCFKQEYEPSLI